MNAPAFFLSFRLFGVAFLKRGGVRGLIFSILLHLAPIKKFSFSPKKPKKKEFVMRSLARSLSVITKNLSYSLLALSWKLDAYATRWN